MTGAAPGAEEPQGDGAGTEAPGDLPRHGDGEDVWFVPAPGTRVRQTVPAGPFVVQHREDLGAGAVKLTGHRAAMATTFEVIGYEERSEIGLPCHVVLLRDEADDRRYVVDTALCGPGLPLNAFSAGTTTP